MPVCSGVNEMAGGKANGKKPQFSTFKLHGEDGSELSQLADLRGMSVANLYREMGFAAKVHDELLKQAEQRLKELKARRPG